MKKKLLILLLAAVPIAAQIITNTTTSTVQRLRVRTEISFRNDIDTGVLLGVQIQTWDVVKVDGATVSRTPGPTFFLSPAQLTASITNFAQTQAAFAAIANNLMTNQP